MSEEEKSLDYGLASNILIEPPAQRIVGRWLKNEFDINGLDFNDVLDFKQMQDGWIVLMRDKTKIIKEGKPIKYQRVCKRCKCKYEFELRDAVSNRYCRLDFEGEKWGTSAVTICPCCGQAQNGFLKGGKRK